MILKVDKINKSFGANHVLRDVGFEAKSGVALGLLGRNGSGKTTTIRVIMDIFPADSGEVTIDGVPVNKAAKKFGYLPEERGLYPKRVIADQMAYIGELRGLSASDARARSVKLLDKLEAGEYYKKKLETLSKGNQQKIQLAIALINDPEIVILDEPFSGLDPVNAKILKDLVSELVREGRMVIFSSHQMGYVEEFCDDICLINKGEIVLAGNLRKIKKGYPRGRVMITPEDEDMAGFCRRIQALPGISELAGEIRQEPRGLLLNLRRESDKPALLSLLASKNVAFDSFAVVEPSLEEIFVEKAGDINEAV